MIQPPAHGETPSNPELNQKLRESDAEALSALDAPETVVTPEPEKVIEEPEVAIPEPTIPEAEIEEPVIEDDDKKLDDELALLQPRKGSHPNQFKMAEVLKGVIKREREIRKAKEASLKEIEDKFSKQEVEYKGKLVTPELEKELADLREERRTFHIERDPEFQAKYSNQLKEIDLRAITILRGEELPQNERLSPDLDKFIMDNGGVLAMYNSTRQMPPPYASQTFHEFIESTLMDKLSGIRRTRFEQAIATGMDKRDEMTREIEHAKIHGSELQQRKQKEIEEAFNKSVVDTRTSFGKRAEKQEYPPNATPEDKKRVDKHNSRVKKAEDSFAQYLKDGKNAATVGKAFAEAVQSQVLLEEIVDKDEEIEALKKALADNKETLKKIKGSGATGKVTAAPAPSSKPDPGKLMTDAEAIDAWEKGK